MKRYLVYYKKKPLNGISAIDYTNALAKAKEKTPKGDRQYIRVRLANNPNNLIGTLARQGDY